jgi:hypothetical protein
VDLPDTYLGVALNNVVLIDSNAAGFGWQTDTLADLHLDSDRIDLLTVVMHELGHLLGLDHSTDDHGLMAQRLSPGVRALPENVSESAQLRTAAVDLSFQDLIAGEHELLLDALTGDVKVKL